MRTALPIALSLLLCGCAATPGPSAVPLATPATPPTPASPGIPGAAVVGCGSGVGGDLGRDWQASSLSAGPPWLVGARGVRPWVSSVPSPSAFGDLWRASKQLILVHDNSVVTVTVPLWERESVSLLYGDPASPEPALSSGWYRVSDGRYAVTFQGCWTGVPMEGFTQFAGGIVVAGVRCVVLDVSVQGRPRPLRLAVPWGPVPSFICC